MCGVELRLPGDLKSIFAMRELLSREIQFAVERSILIRQRIAK